jgi:hypothetical protein
MFVKRTYFFIALIVLITGCSVTQSLIKSTFPYTTDLTVSGSSQPGKEYEATSEATSFDQNFTKSGNNADRIGTVRVTSAKLRAISPADFNIGNVSEIRFYMAKPDGSDEVLVASRTDITPDVGNNMVLDIDNSHSLDQLVRMPHVKIRMVYKLRNAIKYRCSVTIDVGIEC